MVILYMSFLCRLVLSLPIMYYVFICNYFYDLFFFFFSSRRRHTRCSRDWSSDVCSSDLRWRSGPLISLPLRRRAGEGALATPSTASASRKRWACTAAPPACCASRKRRLGAWAKQDADWPPCS